MTIKTSDLMQTVAYVETLLGVFESGATLTVEKTWANERKITISLADLMSKDYEIEVGFGNPLVAAAKIVKQWERR